MARKKQRRIWTVCYILHREDDDEWEDIYSNSWFAYGCDAVEAKEDFMRYFERERENFYCGDDPRWQLAITHVHEGFSC